MHHSFSSYRNSNQRQTIFIPFKHNLFIFKKHKLDNGVARFDSDPLIANSWSKLQSGTHSQKDIQLLQHELFESKFEGIFKTDYRKAHNAANKAGYPSGIE